MKKKITKKKNMKKRITLIAAFVLTVAVTATGTWAYLQQTTQEVKNTFSAAELLEKDEGGEDKFDLEETKVVYDPETNTYEPDTEDPGVVGENRYDKIIPGTLVMKDPVVRIDLKEGINAYLFIEILEEDLCKALKYEVLEHWTKIEDLQGSHGGSLYYYSGLDSSNGILRDTDDSDAERNYYILKGSGEGNLKNGQIEVAADANECSLTGEHTHFSGNLKFYSYVCQAAGFETPKGAYEAVFGISQP